MVGDSVLFGPAVSDDETISGRLRRALPLRTRSKLFLLLRGLLRDAQMLPEFVAASRGRSRTPYLYGDPMHLKAAGHDVAARVIQQSLRGGQPAE